MKHHINLDLRSGHDIKTENIWPLHELSTRDQETTCRNYPVVSGAISFYQG